MKYGATTDTWNVDGFTFASGISSTTRLTWMVGKDFAYQLVGTLLELIDDSVVQGILVLLEPASDVVRHLFNSEKVDIIDR